MELTLIHIPDNTVHLSESCGEDFVAWTHIQCSLLKLGSAAADLSACSSSFTLILIDQPVYAVCTWLYSLEKLYTPIVFSPWSSFTGKSKLEIILGHVVLSWLKGMQIQAGRCDQAWILPKAEWPSVVDGKTWWICHCICCPWNGLEEDHIIPADFWSHRALSMCTRKHRWWCECKLQ